ncbi:MAG: hypothetical protein COB24_08525 [Hyphomicrobiales bacterium]|nr:MAG: hypothetical protein COB24_08525 [Hyphomicrobiales bacterium]
MFKYILIAGIVLVSLMTFQLYEVSYNTNDIRGDIRLLKAEIITEKEKINLLRLELNKAQSPENIQRLNDSLLQLKPQKIDQFITISQMPEKVAILLPEPDNLIVGGQQIVDPIGNLLAQ